MENFNQLLSDSTLAISGEFFQLPIDGGTPVYRERVYAYELYHQLRIRWPAQSELVLNGEVDKSAHPILKDMGLGGTIPDLLAHRPGDMDGNFAIVEIKQSNARAGLKSDLEKLSAFVSKAGYQRAILLLFGNHDAATISARLNDIADEIVLSAPVEFWFHSETDTNAVHFSTIQARPNPDGA